MILDHTLLDQVTQEAKASPRLRMNYNLHNSPTSKAQRLFNALEPNTLLPIHRHPHTDETYILIRGKVRVLFYNDHKEVQKEYWLDLPKGNFGVHIPANTWHTLEVIESGTAIFEVKEGPYTPLEEKDIMK